MVFNNLNKIYDVSISVMRSHKYKLIPLSTLSLIIGKAKLKNNTDLPDEFVIQYNAMLDTLYDSCFQNATKSKLIYPELLKGYIAIMKKSFADSLSKN